VTDLLRVHELGRPDGPTLVLLHGFTDSGLCWPDAVRRWRDDYRIVAPDARGHGESARFDTTTSGSNRSEDLAADVVSILEGLARGGGDPPILVGHSMGAGIAGIVLAERPDLAGAAVLEDPPWATRPPGDDTRSHQDSTHQWPQIELPPWALSKTQLDPSLTDPEQIIRRTPWIEDAAAITRPTLLVTGGRDDAVLVTPLSRQRLAELGNRNIEVVVVPGAGHTVRRDCADEYHQVVDPWIKESFRRAASS
jgi:pimeloyl-ACP methyl ester carboxylesterase